jgi:hypothetical protein
VFVFRFEIVEEFFVVDVKHPCVRVVAWAGGALPCVRPLWCYRLVGFRWICGSFGHKVKSTASVGS